MSDKNTLPIDHGKIKVIISRGEDEVISTNRNYGVCRCFGNPDKTERDEIKRMLQRVIEAYDEIDRLGL